MGKGLPDTHSLLWLVDQQVSHKVLCLPGDVLPKLKVEVNISHLDTLESLSVVLTSEGGDSGQEEVGDDTAGPHVGGEGCSLAVDDLGSHVLGLTVLKLDDTNDSLGEREVTDLDLSTAANYSFIILFILNFLII